MKKNILFTLKLMPNFIIASILSFMSIPIMVIIKSNLSVVFTSIIPIFLVYCLIYKIVWLEGGRDPNKEKIGQLKHFKYKGLVIGALAVLPSLIFLILYLITNNIFINILFYILNFNLFSLKAVFPNTYNFLYFIIILFIPILSQIAYILGYKRIEISRNIIYKKTK